MQCAKHPQVDTGLACGRCAKAICPACFVSTPVGFRCETCAQVRKNPALVMSGNEQATAIGAAIGLAILGGAVWALAEEVFRGLFTVVVAVGIGYVVSEGIMRATKRSVVVSLRYLAGASALAAFFVGNVLFMYWFNEAPFATALAHFWSDGYASIRTQSGTIITEAFKNPDLWTILSAGLSVYIAYWRTGR